MISFTDKKVHMRISYVDGMNILTMQAGDSVFFQKGVQDNRKKNKTKEIL